MLCVAKLLKLITFVYLICGPITGTGNVKRNLMKKEQHLNKSKHISRVYEGRDLAVGEYPFVILLVFMNEENGFFARMCTGSMITATWGITAAHCGILKTIYNGFVFNQYVAYDNFTELPSTTELFVPVMESFKHPSYQKLNNAVGGLISMMNDIALFRCNNVPVKAHAVLLAADYTTLVGLPVVYVGGGKTYLEENELNSKKFDTQPLQLGEATIINCDDFMRTFTKTGLCLASKCSNRLQTPLPGDSGGPLLYDGKIIGVASNIIQHARMMSAAYTPVSPYLEWIYRVVNGKRS